MTAGLASDRDRAARASRSSHLRLRVTASEERTAGVREVEFAAEDGRSLPSFTPGSHLVLHCGSRRNAYSLTGSTLEPMRYTIAVLRQPSGLGGSEWVHRDLRVGHTVQAAVPRSAFSPVASARHHLLVAGGIGVTAILSHVRAAVDWDRDFTVLYVHRQGTAPLLDQMRALCGHRLVELHDRQAARSWLAAALRDQVLGTHVYTCGPNSLIDEVAKVAADAGWPAARVHAERFMQDELPPGRPFVARLVRSARSVSVPSGTSLLEALEDSGTRVANRCRQGVCGECVVPVVAGRPDHRDLFLSPQERAAGDCLMSCVSRSCDDVLEIDL